MKIFREKYFNPNGQLEYKSTINANGIGHDQHWYGNGNKMIEFYFKNGCFGIYKHWFEFGSLKTIEQNKQGIMNGFRIEFNYENEKK